MENQSPLTLNPVFNDPCSSQGNLFKRKILKASFPRCPLGFYTLRSFYKLQQAERQRQCPLSRGESQYHHSSVLFFRNQGGSNYVHGCVFLPKSN